MTLSDGGFLETYYRHHASIDGPTRSPWMRERSELLAATDFHTSCRLAYVAKSVASLWYMHNTAGATSLLQQGT